MRTARNCSVSLTRSWLGASGPAARCATAGTGSAAATGHEGHAVLWTADHVDKRHGELKAKIRD
jgi:hypothetical protein